ncbi:hypothetical protein D3C74_429610 [compost metagenome]
MKQKSFRSWPDTFGNFGQHIIGIDAKSLRCLHFRRGEFIPHPAKQHATVIHRPPNNPKILCKGVTERSTFWVGNRTVHDGTNGTAGSDGCCNNTRFNGVNAEIG